jgi:hypothetical protein
VLADGPVRGHVRGARTGRVAAKNADGPMGGMPGAAGSAPPRAGLAPELGFLMPPAESEDVLLQLMNAGTREPRWRTCWRWWPGGGQGRGCAREVERGGTGDRREGSRFSGQDLGRPVPLMRRTAPTVALVVRSPIQDDDNRLVTGRPSRRAKTMQPAPNSAATVRAIQLEQ